MRILFIDPFNQTLQQKDHPKAEDLISFYKLLECQLVEYVPIGTDRAGNRLLLVIDEEGRLMDEQRCFTLGDALFAGRALIMARDSKGLATDICLSGIDALAQLSWLPKDTDYTPTPPTVLAWEPLTPESANDG